MRSNRGPAARSKQKEVQRYKPIIHTCEDCGKKNENVESTILIKLETPVIKTAYLNKWTYLCPDCKSSKTAYIESRFAE